MSNRDFRAVIAEYVRANAKPPDKLSHQPRLYELACALAEGKAFDDEVLYAAAWLHDIGVFIGHRPEDPAALAAWNNVAYAVERVPGLLEQFGFPAKKISSVVEAIRNHLPSGNPASFEGVLLREADILEQLGAIGILRTVSKVGRDTRFKTHADAIRALARNAQELPPQLKLPAGRRLAQTRLKIMKLFLNAVADESGQAGL